MNIRFFGVDKSMVVCKNKDELSNFIIDLFKERGNDIYDEGITQIEHGLQTMNYGRKYIEKEYKDDSMLLACFLHDIGHILIDEQANDDWETKDYNHETIAFQFLNQYFNKDISVPVCLHVKAKKYLCSINKKYYDKLSSSSKHTLQLQGGLMNEQEIKKFESNSYFKHAIDLRIWEDESKILNQKFEQNYKEIDQLIRKHSICKDII